MIKYLRSINRDFKIVITTLWIVLNFVSFVLYVFSHQIRINTTLTAEQLESIPVLILCISIMYIIIMWTEDKKLSSSI